MLIKNMKKTPKNWEIFEKALFHQNIKPLYLWNYVKMHKYHSKIIIECKEVTHYSKEESDIKKQMELLIHTSSQVM